MRLMVAMAALVACAPVVRAETVTIGAAADNTLFEDAAGSLSNGAGEYLFAGSTLQPGLRRGLIRFDIAGSVPAGATITSATIGLTMSRGGSSAYAISFHRALAGWGEGASDALGMEGAGAAAETGDATWLHASYPRTMWTTPGGDFDAAVSTTKLVSGAGGYFWPSTPRMVADVSDMLAQPGMNFGWVILGDEADVPPTAKRFNSRENVDAGTRPSLVIEYEVPAVGAGVVMIVGVGVGVGVGARRRARV